MLSLTFTPPQTAHEALIFFVPAATALLGLLFFLMPKRSLAAAGLEARPETPDAIGEGRATYGGALLALGLCCLLLQEPKALQPGLHNMLSIAWALALASFTVQLTLDQRVMFGDVLRVCVALVFATLAWATSGPVTYGLKIPETTQDMVFAGIAVLTILLGLTALLLPKLALRIMRLKQKDDGVLCICGPRGIVGGFYVAAGIGLLIVEAPFVATIWLQLQLASLWLFTGIGRVVAMFFDPNFLSGFSRFNIIGAVFELSLGFFMFAYIVGLI